MEREDPLPIEKSYAAHFASKLINTDFITPILGGVISSILYGNNVEFKYYGAKLHIKFRAIEKGVRVSLEVLLNQKERNFEGDVFFDDESGEGVLSRKVIREILENQVIKGIRNVYSNSE